MRLRETSTMSRRAGWSRLVLWTTTTMPLLLSSVGGAAVFETPRRGALLLGARRVLGGGLLVASPVSAATCSGDECIFEKRRTFERGGRSFVVDQEFTKRAASSTGRGVWECAEVLSAYVASRPELCGGRTVVEVGAGCGLCSMVASAGGARRVVATDGDEAALAQLRSILEVNAAPLLGRPAIELQRLRWEEVGAAAGQQQLGAPFDVVIGADVTYYPGSANALANALLALTSQRSTVLLAHKRRQPDDDKTIATLATYFAFTTLLPPPTPTGVALFQLTRLPAAPRDLKLDAQDEDNCNPGYRRVNRACVLDPASSAG